MKNIDIPEHEIDGLIQTMRETGIKGLMKYTDVLVLNHMMERGWITPIEQREELIKTLKGESDMEYNEIMNLLQRYDERNTKKHNGIYPESFLCRGGF